MLKKERILENRLFSEKKDPYETFEKKVLRAFYLERRIMMGKFSKEEQYQSRVQYIVYLVSCLEFFLEEIFKKSLDKEIIPIGKLKKLNKINHLKFSLEEIQDMNKNKIKLSEVIAEEMRFQNPKDMSWLWVSLGTHKNFKLIIKNSSKFNFPDSLKKGVIPSQKEILKFMMKNFRAEFALPKTIEKFKRMDNTVRQMISLRHKIVHKAHTIKMKNVEAFGYTMATIQLAFFINEAYKLKVKLK